MSSLAIRVAATVFLSGACGLLHAATVHWLDPLAYRKPAALDIAMPDEASATKYYVDFDAGADSPSCGPTDLHPCQSLRGLAGRNLPGLAANPADAAAYVYLRGSGKFFLYNNAFAGTPGREIVIRAWPGYTYTSTGDTPALGYDKGQDLIHDVIIDGGPDLAIGFASTVKGEPRYALHINANNITLYRTRLYATTTANLLAVSDYGGVFRNIRIVNNEFYDCNQEAEHQCAAVYVGPCADNDRATCAFENIAIRNNIMRGMGGEAIEINPRGPSRGIEISGNVIRDAGKQTCGGRWDCRPAITIAAASHGSTSGVVIRDNLMWDIGGACIWDKGGGDPPQIRDNVCYDFGKGKSHGVCMQGVCANNRGTARIRGNLIYAPNGTPPLDASPFVAEDNMCDGGQQCGKKMRAWSSRAMQSLDPNHPGFMRFRGQ